MKTTIDESGGKAERVKTTINNIVMHYHDDVTLADEVHEDYFFGKNGSEMKHIQKDYKVKMYIFREFSCNQSFASAGEKNDEDHAFPSVMKLTEKLTDEEVDEMILETDVDETQLSSTARRRISSSARRKNRGSCQSIPRERIPERIVAQIVNMSEHTHKMMEKIIKDSQSHAASCEHTGRKDCLKTRSSSDLVYKLWTSMSSKS